MTMENPVGRTFRPALYECASENQISRSEIDGLLSRIQFVRDLVANANEWLAADQRVVNWRDFSNALLLDVGLALALGRDAESYSWWQALTNWTDTSPSSKEDIYLRVAACASKSPLVANKRFGEFFAWLNDTAAEIESACDALCEAESLEKVVVGVTFLNSLLSILLANLISMRLSHIELDAK